MLSSLVYMARVGPFTVTKLAPSPLLTRCTEGLTDTRGPVCHSTGATGRRRQIGQLPACRRLPRGSLPIAREEQSRHSAPLQHGPL